MRRAAALVVLASLAACSAEPDPVPTMPTGAFQPVSITLPQETATLPAMPAGTLVGQHCAACHSPDFITRHPPPTTEKWQATVTKMREAYHASIRPADDPAIVAALVTLQSGTTTGTAPAAR